MLSKKVISLSSKLCVSKAIKNATFEIPLILLKVIAESFVRDLI